jgi:hypothetical protein
MKRLMVSVVAFCLVTSAAAQRLGVPNKLPQ